MKKKIMMLAVATLSVVPNSASASFFGEENAILAAINAQLIKNGIDISSILGQAGQAVNIAKDSVGVMRDAYNGVQYFSKFDPSQLGQDLLGIVQPGVLKQGQSLYEDIAKNGLNGGHFNLRTPVMIYDKVSGAWRRIEQSDLPDTQDIELQKSDVRLKAIELAAKRLGEDGGVVDIAAAIRWNMGDRIDPNIISNEANIRAASNAVADLASKSAAEAGDTAHMNALKAAYITAQMTSLSAKELAGINKQMAEMNSWKSIEEAQKLNAKEKEALIREQDSQNIQEEIHRLINSKPAPRPEMKGWHTPSTGGFF